MKAVGIIVEYNPFHNGHLYHIQKAKEKAQADIVIAVMSGPFLQRGEPAIVSKWSRTRMALTGGVDIVVELPYQFALQHATQFALGGVDILHHLQCAALCFGSESGEIKDFIEANQIILEKASEIQAFILENKHQGWSYPKAMSYALQQQKKGDLPSLVDLTKPNNILGLEYVKAVLTNDYAFELLTIPRKSANYHDTLLSTDTIASATSIRNVLQNDPKQLNQIKEYIPADSFTQLQDYYTTFALFHTWDHYFHLLKFRLLQLSPSELQNIYEMEEGLENRFLKYIAKADSFSSFLSLVKTKRYTWTRLQRICVHILTNTTKTEMNRADRPSYIRLLGSTEKGRAYLKEKKKDITLPIVSKRSSFHNEQIELDTRAASIYALASKVQQQQLLEMEYTQPPIII